MLHYSNALLTAGFVEVNCSYHTVSARKHHGLHSSAAAQSHCFTLTLSAPMHLVGEKLSSCSCCSTLCCRMLSQHSLAALVGCCCQQPDVNCWDVCFEAPGKG
jgi:hypothetical protein